MKKLLTLIGLAVLAVYLMPLVTVGISPAEGPLDDIYQPRGAVQVDASGELEEQSEAQGDEPTQAGEQPTESYDERTTITVLVDGEVLTLSLHDYLIGVVAAEMPASFPIEALKAQALAARTYTLYKITLYEDGMDIPESHAGAQLCSDPGHCKAYRDAVHGAQNIWGVESEKYLGIISDAVEQTEGLIAVYDGKPIAAVFHAASDGRTEAAVDVWGSAIPYLQSVETSGGDESPKYYATVTVKQEDFIAAFKDSFPDASFPNDAREWFKASNRSQAGGVIDVAVAGVRVSGAFIRKIAGLNSTNFRISVEGDDIIFSTTGYGHGVGMSQYGARAMALEGASFDEIVRHYFIGAELLLKS